MKTNPHPNIHKDHIQMPEHGDIWEVEYFVGVRTVVYVTNEVDATFNQVNGDVQIENKGIRLYRAQLFLANDEFCNWVSTQCQFVRYLGRWKPLEAPDSTQTHLTKEESQS